MSDTLTITYHTRTPGLRGGVCRHNSTVEVVSREEFTRLAAENPKGPCWEYGTAAGCPRGGYWVDRWKDQPEYDALMEHIGHGYIRPVVFCRRDD